MIKRTIYFGNPAYLSVEMSQLCINNPQTEQTVRIPIEDIGVLVIDHPQITMTSGVVRLLLANNVAFITCDERHLPAGLMLNLQGHSKQAKHIRSQLEASKPLSKRLWQTIIRAKITNQAQVLKMLGIQDNYLRHLATTVKSGDSDNREAVAAQAYWSLLFETSEDSFYRDRYGPAPNHLLNYGYSILRSVVARSLVASGLLPVLGIHHRNQYNDYALADDVMEPYRPYIDHAVMSYGYDATTDELTKGDKQYLLQIPMMDVRIGKKTRPLMIAVQQTTASLARSFELGEDHLVLPTMSR